MKPTTPENDNLSILGDSHLWLELRRDGNPDVLHALFYRYYNDLYHYGSELVNDNDLILDTIQDVFSILWENRKRLSEVQHVRAYLFKTFRNRLLKTFRSNSHFFLFRDIGILTENESSLSPEDIIVQRETKTEISNSISTALEDLTTKQKEILYLRFNCKLSIEEISQTLSIRKQSVSNLLNRAICKLRSNI